MAIERIRVREMVDTKITLKGALALWVEIVKEGMKKWNGVEKGLARAGWKAASQEDLSGRGWREGRSPESRRPFISSLSE